jgi:hypothetical protein
MDVPVLLIETCETAPDGRRCTSRTLVFQEGLVPPRVVIALRVLVAHI